MKSQEHIGDLLKTCIFAIKVHSIISKILISSKAVKAQIREQKNNLK